MTTGQDKGNDMSVGTNQLKDLLETCWRKQAEMVEHWHACEPMVDEKGFVGLALAQHLKNFQLWHVEDKARRTDVDGETIARCKRDIDRLNQERNDLIEEVDAWLVEAVLEFPAQRALVEHPVGARPVYNTETLGSALDRLSILSLKLFHMQEQTDRLDADWDHIQECRQKLSILQEQHRDLSQAILDLVEEYWLGTKVPKVYYQFKMYNDPSLNPELYVCSGVSGSPKE
jgi:cell division protein FtsB